MNTENDVDVKLLGSITSQNLKLFFKSLFTSWNTINIDMILSNINIDTMHQIGIYFEELFLCVYELSSEFSTSVNAGNVNLAINAADTLLPELLILKSNKLSKDILKEYNEKRVSAFNECFRKLEMLFSQVNETLPNETLLKEMDNILLVLTRLTNMKYFESYIYHFATFLWRMFSLYRHRYEISIILLFSLSSITDRLVTFLLWRKNGENVENHRNLALDIFKSLKNRVIEGAFRSKEIVYVLNILDQHDRFIGKFYNAVPENEFCDGYIICSSLAKALENDDAYELFLMGNENNY